MGGIDVANGVVGAVLGMLFAVLFQQPLQNGLYRLRTRSARGMREELAVEPHEYSLELLAFVLDIDKRGAPITTPG
ncbi:hypothetical protein [Streptomyces sp. NPDC046925]|uniref:hypothetical protein n=1 Tax=Streptomyces sp. NPDC046925 TaxID=3155375 RepID=UPI0033D1FB97